jgi:hypothetical protein
MQLSHRALSFKHSPHSTGVPPNTGDAGYQGGQNPTESHLLNGPPSGELRQNSRVLSILRFFRYFFFLGSELGQPPDKMPVPLLFETKIVIFEHILQIQSPVVNERNCM